MSIDEVKMSKIERVKKHVRENKAVYITGIAGVVVGVISISVVVCRKMQMIADIGVQQTNVLSPMSRINVVLLELPERSTPSKPIMNVVTKAIYPSIHEASKYENRSPTSIRENVGDLYKFLEVASQN